ncbi:uncharacterized protein LOC110821318 [Carica papaya]|uniref:uncharacterized protein LOC110821318 n=1 Tax=Carica papaya TaxID=3649 RepID=UPI000B8CDCBE|nr:uncharacterized protein LOC110821318 [Carica papaya]
MISWLVAGKSTRGSGADPVSVLLLMVEKNGKKVRSHYENIALGKNLRSLPHFLSVALPGIYASVFDFCAGRCRHNSESVVHENAYVSDFHHCFSLPSNSSGVNDTQAEGRLLGINVIIGRQGESCDSVCQSNGKSCVLNKLWLLNQCDIIQRYMNCKGACLASIGADQPAEVVDDAPTHLNPGACLYSRTQSVLSCDGSHRHTKRLCPCA